MHKSNKKKFLDFPEYPGGAVEFKKFISQHLVYPQQAIENNIEGFVQLSYTIDGQKGKATNITIEKGLGFGCDEEAIRLIKLMQFGTVKNPGYRVNRIFKTKIEFKLPRLKINYELKKENITQTNYYTIKLNNYKK